MDAELGGVFGAEVRQLVIFPVPPDVLDRIEFWGYCQLKVSNATEFTEIPDLAFTGRTLPLATL